MRPSEKDHRLGLIGSNVSGSLSPILHADEAAALGVPSFDYSLLDLEVLGRDPEAAGEVLREAVASGFTGLNVTHPCKQTVIRAVDSLDARAEVLGAVNTVVVGSDGLTGYNTDYSGFVSALERALPGVERERVVLTGAGGAGAAVAHALAHAGVKHLSIVDPDLSRAADLAASVSAVHRGTHSDPVDLGGVPGLLGGADGLVNTSPVGMVGHPGAPVPLSELRQRHWVADIVYRPLETELLRAARSLGCRTMDGVEMLVGQAAEAFALMTGIEPDVERMHRSLRAHLEHVHPDG